ncbi:hypothetical protein B0H14DRAFT_3132123 [Mycena olivaceomarginata]|nr:hypothetical protein B0H14DRAFT_3132123 [Mycena olivaceomarginata]
MQQMRSVLIPGMTTSFEGATPQMHKSFRDYIMDGHAPAEFCVLTGNAHFVTARSCLEVIVQAGSQSDVVVKYSVQHWHTHLRKAVEGGMTWEDERMENLFEQMMEEAVVEVWKAQSWRVFLDVAAAGWRLSKKHANKDKMQGISNILIKAKRVCFFSHCPCLSCSLFLAFLSLGRSACFSPLAHVCLAHFFLSPSRL